MCLNISIILDARITMRLMKWFYPIVFLLFVTILQAAEPQLVPVIHQSNRQPTELLVKFKSNTKPTFTFQSHGKVEVLQIERIKMDSKKSIATALKRIQEDEAVEWVQPNYWRHTMVTEVVPDDPYYRPDRNQRQYQQWYLPKINANYAWSQHKGDDQFIVAVVDTGIDLNHPDLKERLIAGISIVNQDDYIPPADGMDDNGHGSHVAGLIGATSDNNIGIVGCSWQGKLMPVKVLNNAGEGTDADIAQGIIWAADHGAHVINLSLGGSSDDDQVPQVMQDAIDYAYAKGSLIVAASGNSGDRTKHYPAALPHVFSVAATNPWDERASYSTYGPEVDIAAPGGAGGSAFNKSTGMISTYWTSNSSVSDTMPGSEGGEYAVTAGTSMAAAVVSGAALVLLSNQPTLSAADVENLFKSTALDIGASGADEETGSGRIDLLAALGNPAPSRASLTTYNYPNPFHPDQDGGTTLVFLLDQPIGCTIRLYDVARDLVWKKILDQSETVSGKNEIIWNGRNGNGDVVANGSYFYRVETSSGKLSSVKVISVLR